MLEGKEAVIFDLDGTLVDSMEIWDDIDVEYLGGLGFSVPPDLQRIVEGMGFTEVAVYFKERFQIPDSIETIKQVWQDMAMEKYCHEVPLKPGVKEFLQYLRERQIPMAVASSNHIELIKAVLRSHEILGYFDCIITACDVKKGKPSPDVYLAAAAGLGVKPEKCLVFEDIVPGIQAGKNAGMTTCAVEDRYSAPQREEKKRLADYYINSYDEIMEGFLPVTLDDMKMRGWDRPDFVYVTGDAYVDHPSFGSAIITRLLQSRGYRVCIISQPDWRREESIQVFGEPRLGFLVSAGNMDSMVNHYTVSRKHRQKDAYSPGGVMGLRPDRACIVYSNLIRRTYKSVPIILGGIEASLRRLSHYDYWENKVKRSILLDSGADLVSYGMGEHSILEIAEALDSGIPVKELTYIPGTVCRRKSLEGIFSPCILPSYEAVCKDKKTYAQSFACQYKNTDPFTAAVLAEPYEGQGFVVQNPPAKPLTMGEMDDVYDLPYLRKAHPMYDKMGGIPALEEVKFSLTSNRGCFGGCNFCALTFHQGRILQTRSHDSLVKEARQMTKEPDFKGYIHDVGGPTADFRLPSCEKQLTKGVCQNRQCLFPTPCKNLRVDHQDYLSLLRTLRGIPKVKKVFIRSGIRFDYVAADKDKTFLKELVEHHISGQLRVAPEHVSDRVLHFMGKPSHEVYEKFLRAYQRENEKTGKKQYAIPYFMSSHPGCTMKDAVKLAEYVRDLGYTPEQAQDFYPTPSTLSTCMYYTGLHPLTMEPVYVPVNPHEKAIQRALIQFKNPANRSLVLEGLKLAGREDLIGFGPKCLLRPRGTAGAAPRSSSKKKTIRNVHKKKKTNGK